MATKVLRTPWQPGGLIPVISNPEHTIEKKSYKPFSKADSFQTNTFFNNSADFHLTNFSKLVGGKHQEWTQKVHELKPEIIEKPTPPKGEEYVKLQNELENPYGQNPFNVTITECDGVDDLCNHIRTYAENCTSLSEATINRHINYIQLMADKENNVIPIDFFNPSYPQYLYHMNWYRKYKYDKETGKNFYGLKQRKYAFELYLESCGINKGFFQYHLPKHPEEKPIEFPNPEIAFKITRHRFFKDDDENKLYQMIHLYNFIVGCRPEAEDVILRLDNINWHDCIITYPQPKRNHKLRAIFLDHAFINGRTRKSLRNYVDYLRPKFENQHSKDYLFISPKTGRPFTKDYLRKQLTRTGKMVYKPFYPYMSRHFCASGMLIRCYNNKDVDPIKTVKEFMDHKSQKNTERYTAKAKSYYEKYSYDWFKRLLKDRNKNSRGKGVKSKQRQKTLVSHGNPSRGRYSPERIRTAGAGSKGQRVNRYTTGLK